MYQKKSHGWYKHKDFILLDLLCIFLAFIFAYYIRNHTYISITDNGVYRNAMIFVLFADLVVIILFEIYTGVLRRGYYREFIQVLEQVILIELAAGLYLFTVDDGRTFSRAVLYLTGVVYGVLSYIVRIFWKKHLIRMMAERGEHSLYIITSSDIAESVVESVRQHNYNRYDINGIIVTDCDMTGKEIAGVPVVAASSDAAAFICQHWVDEVLINVAEEHTYPQKLYEELLEMGIVVHVNLSRIQKPSGQKQFVEKIGNYTVIPDGGPLSTVGQKRGHKNMERTTGPSLMGEIFEVSAKKGYRHYFYGSKEETLELLYQKLTNNYPGIQIAGMYSPPFRPLTEEEDRVIVERINETKPDFVWVGLGAPKQEKWMVAHQGKIDGLMLGVGAGFDYYAENIKRAPMWMQKHNLEWVYRLVQDPKRLFKRYWSTNTKFIWNAGAGQ